MLYANKARWLGIGSVAYVEYARRLFPDVGTSDEEINNLTSAMYPGKSRLGSTSFPCSMLIPPDSRLLASHLLNRCTRSIRPPAQHTLPVFQGPPGLRPPRRTASPL